MKKILTGMIILFSATLIYSQDAPVLDTIIKLGGRRIYAKVTNVGSVDINYVLPDDENIYTIERKQIERIHYASGRKEKFSDPVVVILDDVTDWRTVLITHEKKDVEGFYYRGDINAKAPPSNTKKRAKSNCEIRLKKKAAGIGGIIILITNEEAIGGYGEMPSYSMEGIAYGTEPLPDPDEKEINEQDPGQIKR
ncbi:MAG: hypothetical protein JXB49_16765 [Bacteroidales bacterium]|nr:hypothetical protein [Bacteroidales bacterium]